MEDPIQLSEPLQTAEDVAHKLGIAPRTIYLWARKGTLPHYRIGSAVRFRDSEIEAWLQTQRLLEVAVG